MTMALKRISFILTICFLLVGCQEEPKQDEPSAQKDLRAEDLEVNSSGLSKVDVTLKTAKGNIVFKFYPRKAPNTVTRIMELIQKGFYDGLTFHRVVPNFVIQGGDPKGTGRGGSGQKLKAEFNDIQHVRGTVAMARGQDKDSADSQFYIALSTLPHLDGKYTVFGQVVKGFEVLDKIVRGDKIISMSLKHP